MNRRFFPLATLALLSVLWAGPASAQSCTGRFVNPISDVCWECLFPISIGPIRMGSAAGAPDTPNPGSPICFCGSPIPRIGLSLGVWEPARLMDVSRKPWCFPNLGGLTIDPGLPAARGRTGSSGGDGAQGSVWHAHYYVYPLLSWIGALLDLGCLEGGSLDIAWTSELDPAWLDDELSFLLNPEVALFANLPAQAACAADCAAASAGLPLDPMFWCAGCQGGMYPLTGNVAAHVGGVQASLLAAQRLVYRLHRAGVAWGTSGSAALCGRYPMPVMKKSQYRWQMTQPVPGDDAAHRLQPDGPLLGVLGIPARTAGFRRELRLPALEKKIVLPSLNRPSTVRLGSIIAGFASVFLLGACACPARADDAAPGPGESVRDLVAEVLRKAGGNGDDGLGDWTRSIIDRALKRAGETDRQSAGQTVPGSSRGTAAPLPAERHAARTADGLAGRGNAPEILLFTSLSVPAASWRQWAGDAARIGAPLVMRGVGGEGLRATVKRIGNRLGGHDAGVAIDPRLFRLFGIERVPAVVVVPGGVPPCASRGCADDPAPAHDRVTGNIGLAAALEAVAAEGSAARDVARRHLQRLGGPR